MYVCVRVCISVCKFMYVYVCDKNSAKKKSDHHENFFLELNILLENKAIFSPVNCEWFFDGRRFLSDGHFFQSTRFSWGN